MCDNVASNAALHSIMKKKKTPSVKARAEAGDLGYVAVKHVLSTLFIEHTPGSPSVVFPNVLFCAWRDGVTMVDQRYA